LRRIDVVARYSGDQFAIILLDTNPDTIRPVLEQIREGFAALPFGKPEAPISASISIGLAGTRSHDGLEELVLAATKAAQAAKSAGGNCIEIVTEKP
jgi:diguanylate cyclase (GGDEF)-like protein